MPSVIPDSAQIGSETILGHFCVIGENVDIGSGCRIGHHVVIHDDTIIRHGCVIDDHSLVGKKPLKSRAMAIEPGADLPPLQLSDRVGVGTGAIVFRGSTVGTDSLIADLASVREGSLIGSSTIIGRGVAVENRVRIGNSVKIEAGAFICAFSDIGDGCFVAPEVTLTNDNFLGRTEERKQNYTGTRIERGGRIGANATVLPGRTIAPEGLIAAGAVATRDVDGKQMVAGVPARPLGRVPTEQLLPGEENISDPDQ